VAAFELQAEVLCLSANRSSSNFRRGQATAFSFLHRFWRVTVCLVSNRWKRFTSDVFGRLVCRRTQVRANGCPASRGAGQLRVLLHLPGAQGLLAWGVARDELGKPKAGMSRCVSMASHG